jgi:hypothetical protein
MAQGVRLTDEQIAAIRDAWLLTRNGSFAARQAGCAVQTANAYIRNHRDELLQLAHEKKPEIVDQLTAARDALLHQLFQVDTLKTATVGELTKGIGIITDKIQLITGQATSRNETGVVDPARLTPEERRQLIELRAKMEAKP